MFHPSIHIGDLIQQRGGCPFIVPQKMQPSTNTGLKNSNQQQPVANFLAPSFTAPKHHQQQQHALQAQQASGGLVPSTVQLSQVDTSTAGAMFDQTQQQRANSNKVLTGASYHVAVTQPSVGERMFLKILFTYILYDRYYWLIAFYRVICFCTILNQILVYIYCIIFTNLVTCVIYSVSMTMYKQQLTPS